MSARIYYGWVLAAALGVTATVSWGTLYYAFPVFIVPMGEDLPKTDRSRRSGEE